tara:strand:- start:7341 stop:8501 length:1161 start_codon:yes stop_codon:yes gene_type:complete
MSILRNSIEVQSLQQGSDNVNVAGSGVTGVNLFSPNSTNGSSVTALKNTNNTVSGLNAIQSTISKGLSDAGFTAAQITSFTSDVVSPSVNNKSSLADNVNVPADSSGPGVRSSKTDPATEAKKTADAQGEGSGGGMSFPNTLQSAPGAHTFLKLQFEQLNRSSAQAEGSLSLSTELYFPLPENFQQDINVSFDTTDTGATGTIKEQLQEQAAGFDGTGASVSTGDVLEATAKGLSGASGRAAFSALDSGPLPAAGSEIQKAMGQIYNPHPSVFFKGLPMRQYSFLWKLVPIEAADAANLKKMIDVIKKNILPDLAGDFLTYPNLLQISVEGKGKGRYGVFKKMFVEAFSVNYTGEGTSAFFDDGAPVSIIMSMQLRESEMFTRGDV